MSGQDPFLAEIALFPYNFVPNGWAACEGQLIPIQQNTALFALLGTTYGGDGRSTFALPNLNGRAALHPGQGPGLSLYDQGQTGGSQTVTLLESEIPQHTHMTRAIDAPATTGNPASAVPATSDVELHGPTATGAQALLPAGGGLPHNNMQPSLALHYCIALQGVFPQRS